MFIKPTWLWVKREIRWPIYLHITQYSQFKVTVTANLTQIFILDKDPGENKNALKTPSSPGKQSRYGAKEWQYYSSMKDEQCPLKWVRCVIFEKLKRLSEFGFLNATGNRATVWLMILIWSKWIFQMRILAVCLLSQVFGGQLNQRVDRNCP